MLVSDPDIHAKRQIIDNLTEIAQNIDYKISESREPFYSRALRIIDSMKQYMPVFSKLIIVDDKVMVETLELLIDVLNKFQQQDSRIQ